MKHLFLLLTFVFCLTPHAHAQSGAATQGAFSFQFDWGNIGLCDREVSRKFPNPTFTLQNVPAGTTRLFFKMIDEDRPKSKHGGGQVMYSGQTVVEPGHFKYWRPCPPPDEVHTYTWHGYAINAQNKIIGHATSSQKHPSAPVQ